MANAAISIEFTDGVAVVTLVGPLEAGDQEIIEETLDSVDFHGPMQILEPWDVESYRRQEAESRQANAWLN